MVMPGSSLKILLVEDNLAEARLLQEFLKQTKQFNLVHVKRLGEAVKELNKSTYDIILLDLTLPDSEGLSSLPILVNLVPSVPIVVLTNMNDEKLAIEAVRRGAQDYLLKRHVSVDVLVPSLCYAIERKQVLETLRADNETLETRDQERTNELIQAKEINQFKSEFVSMLSHDIRNPLNTILLAAGLLQKDDEKVAKEKKHSHYQMIRSAIKNMVHMLDEASFIGKTDSDKLECQLMVMNLPGFCREIVAENQLAANEKHLTLIFTTQDELEEAVADESLLLHILGNLLNNAIKYSLPGGIVLFELIRQEKTVIFRIQDSGIGIPQEDQKQLFQPFHRADNVGKIPGSGLGLAIVKKCIERHKGEISVSSEEEVGTTFIVTLPLISAEAVNS